ncbi:hypothetical protein FBU59_006322, partial [Linderina macrospora]
MADDKASNSELRNRVYEFLKSLAIALLVFNLVSIVFGGGGLLNFGGDSSTEGDQSTTEPAVDQFANMTMTPALVPYWRYGDRMSLSLFVSEDAECSNATIEQQSPAWEVKDILYGDTSIDYQTDLELVASANVQSNGTLYAHAVFTRNGYGKHPKEDNYDADNVSVITWPLTYYVKYRKPEHVKKLVGFPNKNTEVELSAEEVAEREQQHALREARELEMDGKLVSYWYPNLTLAIVDSGMELYPFSSEPPVVHKWIRLADVHGKDPQTHLAYMKPIFFVNDFWRL